MDKVSGGCKIKQQLTFRFNFYLLRHHKQYDTILQDGNLNLQYNLTNSLLLNGEPSLISKLDLESITHHMRLFVQINNFKVSITHVRWQTGTQLNLMSGRQKRYYET